MKTTIFLLTCLASTFLLAKTPTTVKIPLYVEYGNETISTSQLNKQLDLRGKNKILEYLIVTNTSESLRETNKIFWAQHDKVDALAETTEQNLYLTLNTVGNGECYTGSAAEAISIIGSLADGPYSDQMGFAGWKYKDQTHIADGDFDEVNEYLNENSEAWKNWKSKNESILTITHETDDGEDTIEGIITKCIK